MERLIAAGADIHYGEDQDTPGQGPWSKVTALGTAVSEGNIEAALFLIGQGASLGGLSIIDMAKRLYARWRWRPMRREKVKTLVQGLAALGYHIEVDGEVEECNVEGTEEVFYAERGLWHHIPRPRPRPLRFRLKVDRDPSDMECCGA
ncbi:hypothetical protein CLCR_04413 [Cladophialophora carrionii]|uniref:Uncharacterized protein n=1 Tax=Cladophialophora carrionii TaxID=86049 RepID=A0A1C1CHU1_9EURO|nr:hypothetical protein CLCR_04413 [Cladophialophora carrionii]